MKLARDFGADETVVMDRHDASASRGALRTLAPDGFDTVVDATGALAVIEQCLPLTRDGGTVFLYGMAGEEERIELSPHEIFSRELTVRGSFTQAFSFDRAPRVLRAGRVRTDGMITHRFGLDSYGAALDAVRDDRGCVKAVIHPDPGCMRIGPYRTRPTSAGEVGRVPWGVPGRCCPRPPVVSRCGGQKVPSIVMPPSTRRVAGGTVHEGGVGGEEEGDGGGDLGGLGQPPHRGAPHQRLPVERSRLQATAHHLGGHVSRCHGVDPDAGRAPLGRQGPGEAQHSALGGGVAESAGEPESRPDGTDVDHTGPAAAGQQRVGSARECIAPVRWTAS
ncbi:zinc-binding dehydrogenase [Streptomyces sp. 11-1-2]|uniref:zinc-binding dehydrogenase n=1 Tax=Streptomyces sp. 11-1-2 TaxID=1851167 RepID=UPI001F0965B3|nr:zinc-binding dehydrogenase [Streptomyces sp. 11-1-2]